MNSNISRISPEYLPNIPRISPEFKFGRYSLDWLEVREFESLPNISRISPEYLPNLNSGDIREIFGRYSGDIRIV